MPTQFEVEPEPAEWPYYFSHEYPLDKLTSCVCEDGWLPLWDETMVACFVCQPAIE